IPNAQAGVIHVYGVAIRIVAQSILNARVEHSLAQTHRRGPKNGRIHLPQALDRRLERQAREDVPLEIDCRSYFRGRESTLAQPKDAALGDIKHVLAPALRVRCAEGGLTDALHKLRELAFLDDTHAAIFDRQLESTRREGADEYQFLGVLADVDETAAAGNTAAKAARINIALCVALAEP